MAKPHKVLVHASQEKQSVTKGIVQINPEGDLLKPADTNIEKQMIGLYQSICALIPGQTGKTIQFISAQETEGASVLLREFAKVTAFTLKKSVLLLDASLKSNQLAYFSINPKYSQVDSIEFIEPVERAFFLYRIAPFSLYICQVPLRNYPHSALLHSPNNQKHLEKLKTKFDFVLIDLPPSNVSNDCIALSRKLDGIILVVEAESTRWRSAQKLKEDIGLHGGKILGVLINKRRYHIPKFIFDLI